MIVIDNRFLVPAVLIVTVAVAIAGGFAIRQVECSILNHVEGGASCTALGVRHD